MEINREKLNAFFNGAKTTWQAVSDFEVVGYDRQSKPIEEEVCYWNLNLDFRDYKEKGIEFIDGFSRQKVEDIGLKLYSKDLDDSFLKGIYRGMLDTCGVIQVKFEID